MMNFEGKTVRRTINKAFLKEPIERGSFTLFKDVLERLLDSIEQAKKKGEHEEHFKNFLVPFYNELGFGDYTINTSGRIDMAIHTGGKSKDSIGVLIEAKRPGNSSEMISKDQLNRKAMHEAVLYYIDQRIEQENSDLKHIIITNMEEWFIFDAQEFERCFYKPSTLRNTWKEWKSDRKVSSNNDFMYGEIAKYIDEQDVTISGLWLPLDKTRKFLKGDKDSDYEKKLIPIYKLFTPTHLLKEPFANDSNSLNKEFYRELLYILGLEETKVGSTRYIQRVSEDNRNRGSVIENTIRILDAEDHLSTLSKSLSSYGSNRDEQFFSVAMELSIIWMNRVLFLKLLEAQLFRYHRQDKNFKFLNYQVIDSLDELNKLFFQVLARREKERSDDVNEKFGHIPYLNSSLFDVSSLEHQTTRISGLDDHAEIPVYSRSVLTKERGKTLNTLDYLFRFLEAYDFSAEGSEEIRDESKSLINASVLGLIFEKINGYKDGSFYTPGFITEYMARETLQKAVTDAFNKKYDWSCSSFDELYNEIHRERVPLTEANAVINELKICDPAVGSGHFLVSCLNELIAIKSRLDILCDRSGKILRQIDVTVENDELIISWGDEGLFEYDVSHSWKGTRLGSRKISPELERVQEALFHEKRYLIENCLFGVDINPNSVKICRLRLWIELLKRAYYTPESDYMELEVLPNIDINIKQGNSLVSRFELDSDLSTVFKNSEHSLEDYKEAVRSYKQTGDRTEKQRLQQLIDDIKDEYSSTLTNIRPINQKLSKARGRLEIMQSDDLFGDVKFTKKEIKAQKKKLKKLEEQKAEEDSGAFYNQAFEWRFEFPEVLDEEGRFTGFDVVIGNPPYVRQEALSDLKPFLKTHFDVYAGTADLYAYFIEQGMKLLCKNGYFHYIVANKWMRANYGKPLRIWLQQRQITSIIDFGDLPVFEEATTYPCLLEIRNTKNPTLFKALEVERLPVEDFDVLEEESGFEVDATKLSEEGWALKPIIVQDLFEKVYISTIKLGEYSNGKILSGIKTGANEVFIIDEITKNKIIAADPKSKEVIKPVLGGSDIQKYLPPKIEKFLLFIPWHFPLHNDSSITGASQLAEEAFKKSYPGVYNYLFSYKEKLSSRNKSETGKRYEWYALQRCAATYFEEFDKPKIILPDISKRGNFTIDSRGEFYIQNSAYIIGMADKFLLGILNSNLIAFIYKGISSSYRGGYLRFINQYLEQIPIKESTEKERNEIEDKVNEILIVKKQNPEADTSELEGEIDRLVYKLYGLSEEEIEVVENQNLIA